MYEFITQYLRIENNEKSYNNKKLKIKNLKNYKTHKKLFTYLKNLNRNINASKTSESSLSSSTLSIDVYRQNEDHHYTETKIHHINKINDNNKNNNNNLNINKNYYSKCYYRTNCDLYYILIPLIILIIFLITITNCNSEFHLNKTNSVNFNLIYNKLVKSHSNKTILLNYNYNKNNIKNFNTNNHYNDINLKNFSNVQLLRNLQMKSSNKNFINITGKNLNSINYYNNNSNNIMKINNNSNLNQFVKRLIKNTTVDTKQKRHKHFLNNYDSQKNVYDYNKNSSRNKNNSDDNDDSNDNDDEENDFINYSNYDKMIKNNYNLHDYYYFQNFKKRNQLLMNSLNTNSSRRDFPMNLNEQNDEIWNMNTTKNYHYFNKNLKNYDDNFIDDQKDIEKLQQLVLQGLGLTKLPDVSKINISQNEYITKYNEYMLRVKERKQRELLLYNNLEYLDEIKSPKILTTYIHNSSDSNLYLMNYLYPKYFKNFKLNKYIYSNLNDHQLITKNKISNNRRRRRQKRSSNKRNYNENTNNDSFSHGVSSSTSISLLPSSASVSTSSFEFTSHSEGGSSKSSPPLSPTSNRNHDIVYVRFPIKVEDESSLSSSSSSETDVEEANLRLLLIKFKNKRYHSMYDENLNSNYNSDSNSKNDNVNINKKHSTNNMKKKHTTITIKVYQLIEPYDRIWLDSRQIHVDIDTNELLNDTDFHKTELSDSQWLEFDVTKAVDSWINGKKANLGLEIHCEQCTKYNVKILHDTSIISNYYGNLNNDEILSPVLNIIGRTNNYYNDDSSSHNKRNNLHERGKRSRQNHNLLQNVKRKPRKTDCYEENKKCCRHSMEVVFKEIKGFEFIIQPKVFDAGYCRGKCPPRYNPAHHHALLQSLIWKQDKSKAPRPCCAPSKLVELEVLHVDEKDPKKLKVSTWTDMRALECACS